MTEREAKALGRWCNVHNRKHERISLDGGAQATGCRECLTGDGETAEAMREIVAAARRFFEKT